MVKGVAERFTYGTEKERPDSAPQFLQGCERGARPMGWRTSKTPQCGQRYS